MGARIAAVIRRFSPAKPWNLFANAASILGLIVTAFALLKWDLLIIPLLYLCCMSFFLLIRYLRQERWARYAEASVLMENSYRFCQEAAEYSVFGTDDLGRCIEKLSHSLDAFAQAFSLIVGSPCRTCLAEVRVDTSRQAASTIAADEAFVVTVLLRSGPEVEIGEESNEPVVDNSDFLQIYRTGKPYIGNNLPRAFKEGTYENSKWTPRRSEMLKQHDYPYSATIVWPIRLSNTPLRGHSKPPLAFLCVDTKKVNAFVSRADVPLGSCYAHALYPVVRYLLDAETT